MKTMKGTEASCQLIDNDHNDSDRSLTIMDPNSCLIIRNDVLVFFAADRLLP